MKSKKDISRDELLVIFGDRVRKLRKKKKLSGEELGKMVGMSRQVISRLEGGKANPSLIIVSKLCQALEVKIEAFFKGFK